LFERRVRKDQDLTSSNCQNVKAPNIRLSSELAGGPLGDIGIYSINAARYVIGEEPVEVAAFGHQPDDDERFREVPESVGFIMRYPSGVIAQCDCSFGSSESRRYRIHCAEGFIEMDPAFSYRGLRLRVKHGESTSGATQLAEINIDPVNHFAAEMDHFSECIIHDTEPRTPAEMGLADLRIIAALEESMRTGQKVRIM
jgi:predicted dehydrogenase